MRATINFEVDVSKVYGVMRSLVLEETKALGNAIHCMERGQKATLKNEISNALDHIHGVVHQLEQYQSMIISFERSRHETRVPQPASNLDINSGHFVRNMGELREAMESMKKFDNFLDLVNEEDEDDGVEPEEG